MRSLAMMAVAAAILAAGPLSAADLRHFEDASLRAIQFIDGKEGWAVGDEGVVWHTIDGGQTWEWQSTGVRASLRSICFLDPYTGWAVGRQELPGGGSVGVVLFTRDGGVAWKRLLVNALPGLNQVRFVNKDVGFLLADGCAQFPSGLFKTTDGGKNWDPVKGPPTPGWLGGDFHNTDTGILVGPWKGLMTWRAQGFGRANLDDLGDLGPRGLHAVQILPKRIVAVGDGGLVLSSVSGGASWGFADLKLPSDVAACLDFRAIYGVGQRAWIAGRPGSFVLATSDAGATWELRRTGLATPLHGLFFLDEERGWAVGDLGAILCTRDGGKTWQTQQQGGKRAAALLVNARAGDVPLDTVADLGGDGGYLTAVLTVVSADPASASLHRAADFQRLAFATRRAGGVAGEALWHFPLPPHLHAGEKTELLAHWNSAHANRAQREMLRQLVLALRMWRPEVLVTDRPSSSDGAAALVAEALQEAIKQAADPAAFPEQTETLGLAPWRVKKLAAPGDGAALQDNHEPRPRLEGTLVDFAALPMSLLQGRQTNVVARRSYQVLESSIADAAKHTHLMSGLDIVNGDARRRQEPAEKAGPELAETSLLRRKLDVLAENANYESVLAQILTKTSGLSDEHAAPSTFAIANAFARRGQWDLAREMFVYLVDRHPAHPLAADAYAWLIRHNSSTEVRRRYELGQLVQVKDHTSHQLAHDARQSAIQQVKGIESQDDAHRLHGRAETRQWQRGSIDFGKRLAGFGPLFASDPSVQFCLQSAKRTLGDPQAVTDWFGRFKNHVTKGPWHDAAHAEWWLANRDEAGPKRLALCRLTDRRPHLDGDLGDPCWQDLKPLVLEDVSGTTAAQCRTEARFAYDQEFLYVALHCTHPQGKPVPLAKERRHDADLEPYDRVSILLDLDRDYSTYYQLQVDERGCVRDDCWGDLSWNPKWYVAAKNDSTSWTIEIAIPLGELTSQRIILGSAWACNLVRVLPGRGVQAYSLPADVTPRPEGMCLLLFGQDSARTTGQPMKNAK